MSATVTQFLNEVCKSIRQKSKAKFSDKKNNYFIDYEIIPDGRLVSVWFRSKGCSYHRIGSCTMCAYDDGCSSGINLKQMYAYIDNALDEVKIDSNTCLLFSPTGSLLDDIEITPELRDYVYKRISSFPLMEFGFETRIETITKDKLIHLKNRIKSCAISIESGIESTSEIISTCCLNKPFHKKMVKNKVNLIKKHELNFFANIFIGSPFLSPNEMVIDATKSAKWLLDNQTDRVVLLPVQVKERTLLHWLFMNKLYTPPPLWALVDVLVALSDKYIKKYTISLYKDPHMRLLQTGFDSFEAQTIVKSTFTCQHCYEKVIRLLDEFKNTESKKTIDELSSIDCTCKDEWTKQKKDPHIVSYSKLINNYEIIAKAVISDSYWNENKATIGASLKKILRSSTEG